MGLGKESMCVVSDDLSRGYVGVGSLGTRSEISAAAPRRRHRRSEAAMAAELPGEAADRGVPEPNTGSDLAR